MCVLYEVWTEQHTISLTNDNIFDNMAVCQQCLAEFPPEIYIIQFCPSCGFQRNGKIPFSYLILMPYYQFFQY